ncbi:MAG: response regulator transcription factor [Cytophagales bacterium]|nr:response regulator transcription factor [Cytophagales bacterium]
MIKVLIVDDHDLFAEGVKFMFQPEDEIQVVKHTKNGNEAPHILENHEIDVILMDIDMPILDGIATMELLHQKGYDHPILMLTMHQSMKQIRSALEKGAQGYILKDASREDLVDAINKTHQRQSYFHPKINEQIFDYFRGKRTSSNEMAQLSSREKELVKLIADGMNSKAIANSLHLSEHTVRTHRRNIMQKLKVKTAGELIRIALEKGII